MQTTSCSRDPGPARPVAGIPRDNLYRLSLPFLDILNSRGLGLQGLRLAHLIAHAICRKVSDWHQLTVCQPDEGDLAECLQLRHRLGLECSGSNRALAQGIGAVPDAIGAIGLEACPMCRFWLRV